MRGIECIRNFDRKREERIHLKRLARNAVLERHPFEKLHHDKGLPVMLADLVDGADVRMIECRRCPRLAAESFERLPVRGYALGQELDRDKASEFGIFGLEDDAHTAPAKFFHDPVVRYGGAKHEERWYVHGSCTVNESPLRTRYGWPESYKPPSAK